ncbi:hypothetical protein E2C01_080158 [Portunus trituberculatus]|uniref:Uncharacterized protein n=1 Tax=Portunus trituberculatus TaxID=210409 RepID=A0A5B7IUP3_PORTR|nr:hypothetical protein [Portunus trituberculatus]
MFTCPRCTCVANTPSLPFPSLLFPTLSFPTLPYPSSFTKPLNTKLTSPPDHSHVRPFPFQIRLMSKW